MAALIVEDTRQQVHGADKHAAKHRWWEAHGVDVVRRKLDFGDYMAEGSNVSVDTKRLVDELAMNIGGRNHDRFKRECVRAQEAGCRLVVLVEDPRYSALRELGAWTNGHCMRCGYGREGFCDPRDPRGKCPKHGTNKPIQGPRLARAMATMATRYGVAFELCAPTDSARRICELLGVAYE